MRFEELSSRRQRRALTMAEAVEMLGVTERKFRRWLVRYEAEGVAGVEDRRLGRASAHAVPVDEVLEMVTLYESQYTGWPVKHFHKRWQEEHGGGALVYMDEEPATSHRTCAASAPAWGAPHEAARKPGMLLHQDGSTHQWVPGCQRDLIVTRDDATSTLYSAFCGGRRHDE